MNSWGQAWSLAVAVALLVGRAGVGAEPAPDRIRDFAKACERERLAIVARLEKQVVALAAAIKETERSKDFPTRKAKVEVIAEQRAALAKAKKELASYRSRDKLTPPGLALPAKTGNIGVLQTGTAQVLHVTGEREALVQIRFTQPQPPKTMREAIVLLRGVATSHMTDGDDAPVSDVLEVTGEYTYETALGSRTVPVLEPFDVTAVERLSAK